MGFGIPSSEGAIPMSVGSHFPSLKVTTLQLRLGSRSTPEALKARSGRCCSWRKRSKNDISLSPQVPSNSLQREQQHRLLPPTHKFSITVAKCFPWILMLPCLMELKLIKNILERKDWWTNRRCSWISLICLENHARYVYLLSKIVSKETEVRNRSLFLLHFFHNFYNDLCINYKFNPKYS